MSHATGPKRRASAAGVTLIELLVVITLVGILTALGVGSYRYITDLNRVASEVNGLLGDLQLARAEAQKQGWNVTACVSTDGATCTGGTSWHSGWVVFTDLGNDQSVDAGDPILRVQTPFISSDTFTANNAVTAITFNREGFAVGIVAGTQVTLHDAANLANVTRCLTITLVGQLAIVPKGGTCT